MAGTSSAMTTRGHVSRAQRSTQWCAADPGSSQAPSKGGCRNRDDPGPAVHHYALHRIREMPQIFVLISDTSLLTNVSI